MNLYLISQEEKYVRSSYDAAVVCAPDKETARNIYPGDGTIMESASWLVHLNFWCSSPNQVTVQYLGKADESIKQGVVLASYNAG
jgi:hypothetical protein